MILDINNETDFEIDEKLENIIKECIETTINSEKINNDFEVSLSFVNNEKIKMLNKDYRNIDKATDVLSFPMIDFTNEINISDENLLLGDIVISIDKVYSQAEEYNHSIVREIAFLVVHSMLHLLGYDHEDNEDDKKIMFDKQKNILDEVGIKR